MLGWLTPLYILSIYGIIKFFTPPKSLKDNEISWKPLETVGVTLAIYFVTQFIGALLIYGVLSLAGWSEARITDWLENAALAQFLFVIFIEILSVWLLILFLKRRKASLKTVGLVRKPLWSDIGYALTGFGAYFLLFLAASSIAQGLFPGLNVDQKQQIGFEGAHGGALLLVFISLVILPPIVEEIMIRGFLYSGLRKWIPKIWAVLITSGLFAVAHLQADSTEPLLWIAAIDTFTLSLVLIYLKEKTGSLWASIGLHMLKNSIAFLALFVFTS